LKCVGDVGQARHLFCTSYEQDNKEKAKLFCVPLVSHRLNYQVSEDTSFDRFCYRLSFDD